MSKAFIILHMTHKYIFIIKQIKNIQNFFQSFKLSNYSKYI